MPSEHIVTAYDDDLQELRDHIARMGGLAEAQLVNAMKSVVDRDEDLACRTVEADNVVDELEQEVDERVERLIALRQPMARDLREIIAALRIATDLERIADYATNVAKRAIALVQTPPVKPMYALPRMSRMTQAMTRDVLDAYLENDTEKAIEVWERDEEVDEMYTSLFRELLTYMMEDPRSIGSCTHLLFIAKNVERIGDHTTNVAETVYYLVNGKPLLQTRPKRDHSSGAIFPARSAREQ